MSLNAAPLLNEESQEERNKFTSNNKTFPLGYLDMNNIEDEPDTQLPIQNNLKPKDIKSQTDWEEKLEAVRIRPTDQIDKPPACLVIEKDGKQSTVATSGNLSVVTGRAKSRKTFVVSFAVAAAVAGQLILERIRGTLPKDKKRVLFFDTEQSNYHVLRVVKRICQLCGIANPDNLYVYALREFSPDDRYNAIEYAIRTEPDLGLVIIDGIRDLAVDPILDAEQASKIVTGLLQWSGQYFIHIMTVLHQNKGDEHVRGHLGTELVNKAETVIHVEKISRRANESVVKPMFCRDREFEPFTFSIDDNGFPALVEDDNPLGYEGYLAKIEKPLKNTPDNMPPDIMKSIVERAFKDEQELAYSQLRTNVMEASAFVGWKLAKNNAEILIQRISTQQWLTKYKPERSRHNSYKINYEVFHNQQS